MSKNKKEKQQTTNKNQTERPKKRRNSNIPRWDRLDNTAHLFPVIAGESMTNTYRIAVELTEEVDGAKLQEALKKLGVNLPDDAQQNQKGGDGQEGDSENQEQQAPESGATEEEGNEDFLPEQQEGVVGDAKDAEIDKEQARALLEIMAEREQEFRDAVKRQSLEGVRLPQPEKDW